MLYINGFVSRRALQTNRKLFSDFEFLARNRIKKKNSKTWILIKLQCVLYQWIRLNELYKLMESFFQILNSLLKFLAKNQKYFKRIAKHEYL